jgi:hypothetical protein
MNEKKTFSIAVFLHKQLKGFIKNRIINDWVNQYSFSLYQQKMIEAPAIHTRSDARA